jgi:hypothetical protein
VKNYTNWSARLYGIDAENAKLRRDERHNALYVDLDEGVSIRIDLNRVDVAGCDRADELERDCSGLRQLADIAEDAAGEIERLLREALPPGGAS